MNSISFLVERLVVYICLLSTGLLTVIMILSVISRYFLKFALVWADETCLFLFAAVTFFGGCLAVKRHSMIAVTLLIERLSGRKLTALQVLIQILILVFTVMISYYGLLWIDSTFSSQQSSAAARIPLWIPYLSLPISALFSVFFGIENIIKIFKGNFGEASSQEGVSS